VARGFLHSHSYTGNPLACRAALATLDLFETTDAIAGNRMRFDGLEQALSELRMHPRVRHLRRQGAIIAFDVDVSAQAAQATSAQATSGQATSRQATSGQATSGLATFAQRYAQHALDAGALLRPIGRTVYLMPPYILDEEEIAQLAAATLTALEKTLSEGQ
jgi:adenosylmethionine---8-amino-7-oxononanoate aminotransferase